MNQASSERLKVHQTPPTMKPCPIEGQPPVTSNFLFSGSGTGLAPSVFQAYKLLTQSSGLNKGLMFPWGLKS